MSKLDAFLSDVEKLGARSLLSEETPSETVREPRSFTSKAAAGLDGGTP